MSTELVKLVLAGAAASVLICCWLDRAAMFKSPLSSKMS